MIKDISNKRFGRLVAIRPTGEKKWGVSLWLCQCDCGNEHITVVNSLKMGGVKSCGCLLREKAKEKASTHGMYGTRVYKSWANMIQRCTNKNISNYHKYGGQGITVCDKWRKFENFYADMGDRPEKMSLDRIDPFGNYEPDNCRWASTTTQRRNQKKPATKYSIAQKIRELRSNGMQPKAISEELDISLGVVQGVIYLNTLSVPD